MIFLAAGSATGNALGAAPDRSAARTGTAAIGTADPSLQLAERLPATRPPSRGAGERAAPDPGAATAGDPRPETAGDPQPDAGDPQPDAAGNPQPGTAEGDAPASLPARPALAVRPERSPARTKGVPRFGTPPVGGLSQQQMDHAASIVAAGERAGMPEQAYVVAIATALQESYLRNLANPALPTSLDLPHDGIGYDHDSVGLFQQRTSTGWGPVDKLMDPDYAATRFYQALAQVPGWQAMPVTVAAQSVQQSAYPYHYAKHEPLAREIVAALTP